MDRERHRGHDRRVEDVLAKYGQFNHILQSLSSNLGVPVKEVRARLRQQPLEYIDQFNRRYREQLLAGEFSATQQSETAA